MTGATWSDVKFLTIYELAVMMRISKMSAYRLVRTGELEAILEAAGLTPQAEVPQHDSPFNILVSRAPSAVHQHSHPTEAGAQLESRRRRSFARRAICASARDASRASIGRVRPRRCRRASGTPPSSAGAGKPGSSWKASNPRVRSRFAARLPS